MRILVACEFSGVVRDAFRARGHDAVSCDLLPSERPGPHITGDVRDIFGDGWDLLIAHPPCTFLANSGAKHLYLGCRRENGAAGDRWANLGHAAAFFIDMLRAPIPQIAVENPISSGTCGDCSTSQPRRRRSSPGNSAIPRPRRPVSGCGACRG
jgi:hypothetical protein